MIEKGKAIVTLASGDSGDSWKLVSKSETILREIIDAFNSLVEEIESRLPRDNNDMSGLTTPMIEEAILDTANPRRGFAYHFTSKAKRPRFRYVALGLEIPTASTAIDYLQPFTSHQHRNTANDRNPPILVFRAIDRASPCIAPKLKDESQVRSGEDSPFGQNFNQVNDYPASLYLSCTNLSYKNAFEGECMSILPLRIGARGWARKSDG
jgi:hypothetical protein